MTTPDPLGDADDLDDLDLLVVRALAEAGALDYFGSAPIHTVQPCPYDCDPGCFAW